MLLKNRSHMSMRSDLIPVALGGHYSWCPAKVIQNSLVFFLLP